MTGATGAAAAVVVTPAQGVKRARAKQGNNVALSLNRMARVKGNVITWLKGFDKQQSYGNSPVSVNFDTRPLSSQLHIKPCASSGSRAIIGGRATIVHSPLSAWTPEPAPLPLAYVCSFCADVERAVVHVRYNPMLPLPYVLLCSACADADKK